MSDKVAIFLTNYNMPEATDRMYEYVEKHTSVPHDWFITDNASDLEEPSIYTNAWIRGHNKQTTAGWLEGLKAAKKQGDYLGYIFTITSCDFPENRHTDPLLPLVELLQQNRNCVGVLPALTSDSTTSWEHLKTRGGDEARRTWFLDNLFCLYRASWFDSIGWFDPDLRYAWGIDLETCYLARREGYELYVHEGVQIRKVTNIAYKMERMRMSADERSQKAGENMAFYLSRKYGADWWNIMNNHYVESEWR